jgi:hypothetical protein
MVNVPHRALIRTRVFISVGAVTRDEQMHDAKGSEMIR